MHADAYSVFADELIPVLEAAAPAGSGEKIDVAMAVLRNWDRTYSRDSRGAVLFEAARLHLARAVFAPEARRVAGKRRRQFFGPAKAASPSTASRSAPL